MVGVVLVAHGRLGEELLETARAIVGPFECACSVSIEPQEGVETIRAKMARAISEVDRGRGVLVLTDMFGGTPANIALSFLDERRVEVVTGCNLPMLLKLGSARDDRAELKDVASLIVGYGQKNIVYASELLNAKRRERAGGEGS